METLKLSARKAASSLRKQAGLSLVELMIGLLIGLILLGGVLQTMLASKEASTARQSMATVTDNARFLFDFMGRDLRMVGRGEPASFLSHTYNSGDSQLDIKYIGATGSEVTATYSFTESDGVIQYSRNGTGAGTLVDRVAAFDIAFGEASGSTISYTAYNASPSSWDDVIAIRARVTFEDIETATLDLNMASTPLVSTFALRNRIANWLENK
ncbi:prepilin-type N-terminal cleavage/methylation domain-containing protein [Marinobacterium sp. AK62]|uniref:Prepilin-type N-terminal cleavage/methylation domain-containing protein n=1 Tax=Marinobacterium alkalitolerans TaxID=1542925 RepID=A0ABS3ZC66_9GAMM|nr:prepilin-type N-terminal cleavage/methylation domain-containing protein [Marinobacterium alkalitolerans]MBP0048868.1 prepilin-type N-terminal cleavage/methylation domain-containing protein [Marinobacterium alkalitolerans]